MKEGMQLRLSIQEIQYVLAVAQQGSITKAAQSLYISQPALSQAIMKIEANIGSPLFRRSKSGFRLTESGEIFEEHGAKIINYVEQIEAEIAKQQQSTREELQIGIPYYLGSRIMPPALRMFRDSFPNIQVFLTEKSSKNLESELLRRKIDLAVIPLPIQSPGIAYDTLVTTHMCVLMSVNNPLVKMGSPGPVPIDLSTLKDVPFIACNESSGQRTAVVSELLLKRVGLNPKAALTTKNFDAIKRMIASGLGVALVPETYISLDDRRDLGLVCVPLIEEQAYLWTIAVAWDEARALSQAAKDFIEILMRYFHAKNDGVTFTL